jgi:hypothetical protein
MPQINTHNLVTTDACKDVWNDGVVSLAEGSVVSNVTSFVQI